MRYANGQPIRLSTTVRDTTGALVDAGAVSLTIQKPDASQQTYATPSHDSTGTYHQDVPATDLATNGHYSWKWVSTGVGAGVSFGVFDVFDPFEVGVLSLQDAKDNLNIPQSLTANDAEIADMIGTIEANLELFTGGPLVTRSITERVTVSRSFTELVLRYRPVVAVTSITDVLGNIVTTTGLDIDTNAGIVRRIWRLPFLSRGPYFTVVYTAGWGTALPPAFSTAARIILNHLWQTQRGPGRRPYGGDETTELAGMSFAVPNRAAELLRPFSLEAFV